jgi:predicted dehydrogenase
LDWDLWLCGAPARPFKERVYHRYNWRGWHDFGTGALGDVGCHLLGLPFRALELGPPVSAEAVSVTERSAGTYPRASHLRFAFDAPVLLEWHDGGRRPESARLPEAVLASGPLPGSGCLLAGKKGVWLMAGEFGARHALALAGERKLVDAEKHGACAAAAQEPKGPELLRAFLDAVRGGTAPAASEPAHVRAVTETVLAGCVAQRVPGRLFWRSRKGRFEGSADANRLVAAGYREGWSCPA